MKNSKFFHFGLMCLLFSSCSKEEDLKAENLLIQNSEKPSSSKTAATVTINWNGNASTFASALATAVNAAGVNGTVNLPSRTYLTDREVIVPNVSGVNIVGTGATKPIIQASASFTNAGMVTCTGNSQIFRNIIFDAKSFIDYQTALNTNGRPGIQAYNCIFRNAGYGMGTSDNGVGLPIDYMVSTDCRFENCKRGILFNRYYNNYQVKFIGKVIIRNCVFVSTGNSQYACISIDCGNDGSDGRDNLKNLPKAVEAKSVITDMNGMEISGCTFGKATNFNLAFAKCKNVSIFNNTFEGTTGSDPYSECLNIEHESSDISVYNNTIKNTATGNHAYISILNFTDYGNTALHSNGCRNLTINNNKFSGGCNFGILGEEAENITITNNTYNTPKPTGPYDINFYKGNLGNRNITTTGNINVPANRISITTF